MRVARSLALVRRMVKTCCPAVYECQERDLAIWKVWLFGYRPLTQRCAIDKNKKLHYTGLPVDSLSLSPTSCPMFQVGDGLSFIRRGCVADNHANKFEWQLVHEQVGSTQAYDKKCCDSWPTPTIGHNINWLITNVKAVVRIWILYQC